jgi:hypothetical protein
MKRAASTSSPFIAAHAARTDGGNDFEVSHAAARRQ